MVKLYGVQKHRLETTMSYRYNNNDYYNPSERQSSRNYSLKHASGNVYSAPKNYNSGRRPTRSRKPKKSFNPIILVPVLAVLLVISATLLITGLNKDNLTKDATKPTESTTSTEQIVETKPAKIEYTATDNTTNIPKKNDAEYAIVVNTTNDTIIAQRKAHKRTYPASTTKIMTLLVAVENIKNMNDTFTMTYEITDPLYIAQASVAGFKNDEKVSMTDLLYGTILPSGADAATGLAISVAGSEEAFVKLMNEKVKELGLKNTHFTNVTGLHHKDNYSSAYDMAIILDAALQNLTCKEVLSTYQHTTAKTKQNPKGILLSSTLFNYMYGTEPVTATILGGKTGYVTEAGYCLASYGEANKSGNEYIVVTFDNSGLWPAFYGQIDLYKEFAK